MDATSLPPTDALANSLKLTCSRCRCSGCGEFFNSVSVFDAHRTGPHGPDRRCLTADEMVSRGWLKNSQGFWISRLRGESRAEARTRGRIGRLRPRGVYAQGWHPARLNPQLFKPAPQRPCGIAHDHE